MTREPLPKGFVCTQCDEHHMFSAYVYGHWDFDLNQTCKCGAEHVICQGSAFNEETDEYGEEILERAKV